jgi:hypothetical protein
MFLRSTNRRCERFRSDNAYWVLSQLPLCRPEYERSARAYGKIASHKFKLAHVGGDPYFAKILGHDLIPARAPSYSVGQSYKDFYAKHS